MKYTDSNDDEKLPPIPKFDLAVADEQQRQMAMSAPTNASNRDYANAQAYIQQTSQLKVLTRIQRDYLAEAYATVGNYELASKTTKDADKKAEWKAVHKAVWKDDHLMCKCPPIKTVEMVNNKVEHVEHSQVFTVGTIFSHKLNTFVRLVRCNQCHHLNTK